MSDFDKEAEREKLRERFAEDEEKRETTERMSELLLQGATMTNSHCDTCGNPLFRYDGQTFCSTCQQVTDEGSETTAEASAGDTEAATERATDDQQIPIDDQPEPDESRPQAASTGEQRQTESRPTHSRREVPSPTTDSSSDEKSHSGSADDLTAAEASLSRTVNRLASAAEETEDIGRVRDQLTATREAAEALEAVRNARR